MSMKSFPAAMTGRIGRNMSGALSPSANVFSPTDYFFAASFAASGIAMRTTCGK